MRKAGQVAALVASGAVIGASLGLLFAPQSGTETRRFIRYQAKKAQHEATRLATRVKVGVERVKAVVANEGPTIKAA